MSSVVDIHKKNGRRPHFDVYIGRKIQYHAEFTEDSKWRNRSATLQEYEQWVRETRWNDLDELEGKVLGCWCVNTRESEPVRCHGQVLMKLLSEKQGAERFSVELKPAPGVCCPDATCRYERLEYIECESCGAICTECELQRPDPQGIMSATGDQLR